MANTAMILSGDDSAFAQLDKYASGSYLMHIFALGLIDEQQLYYDGGYQTFIEYTAQRFGYKRSHTLGLLSVFKRISPFILESYRNQSSALDTGIQELNPEIIQKELQESPINAIPYRKLESVVKLSDTKLRNLIKTGKITLGNNQTFTADEIAKMDRDKLKALVAGKKPPKVNYPENIMEAELSEEDLEFAKQCQQSALEQSNIMSGLKWQAREHCDKLEKQLQSLDSAIYDSYVANVKPVMELWLRRILDVKPIFPQDFDH